MQSVITLRNILVANVINIVFSLVTSKVMKENPFVLTSLSITVILTNYKIHFTKIYFCRNGKLFLNEWYSMTKIVGWTTISFPVRATRMSSRYETHDDTFLTVAQSG